MAFGFAGAAQGAAKSLEDIVAERILAQKLEAEIADRQQRTELERAALNQRATEHADQVRATQRDDDRMDADRRDRNNVRGLEQMNTDRAGMDLDAAIGGLPAHLKPLGPLMKVGGVGKIGPEDLEAPEVKDARVAKLREQNVQDQIRIRNSTREPKTTEQIFVKRGDQVIPIQKGTAQAGDIPYDPVAARSSKPEDQIEAQDTAREASRLASDLLKHPGFGGAFGPISSLVPTLSENTADAESIRDALTSLLTLENMSKMKGVLSDSDMKVLRQASTTLNAKMSEGGARQELQRIVDVMGRVGGNAAQTTAAAPAVDPRVQALIDKYGKKPQ